MPNQVGFPTNDINLSKYLNELIVSNPLKFYHMVREPAGIATDNLTITKTAVDAATGLGTGGCNIALPTLNVSRMTLANGLTVSSSRKVGFRYTAYTNAFGAAGPTNSLIINAFTPTKIPYNFIFRDDVWFSGGFTKWLDSDTTDAFTTFALDGYCLQDEPIIGATINATVIGDSINNGTGPTRTSTMYVQLLKNYLRVNEGISIAIPYNKSLSGSTTNTHMPYFIANKYNVPDSQLYIIALGSNDASQGISAATYQANLIQQIGIILSNEANPIVLIMAIPPLQLAMSETASATLRATIPNVLSAFSTSNPNRVFGFSLGNAFTATDGSFYSDSTPGPGIHPNDKGHLAIHTNSTIPYLATSTGISFINALKNIN